jgi:hypothetical protein
MVAALIAGLGKTYHPYSRSLSCKYMSTYDCGVLPVSVSIDKITSKCRLVITSLKRYVAHRFCCIRRSTKAISSITPAAFLCIRDILWSRIIVIVDPGYSSEIIKILLSTPSSTRVSICCWNVSLHLQFETFPGSCSIC